MKFSDILCSIFLHAGLVAGVMYGLRYPEEVFDELPEPVFFEILEECAVSAFETAKPVKSPDLVESVKPLRPVRTLETGNPLESEKSVAPSQKPEPEIITSSPNSLNLSGENSIRNKFSSEENEYKKEEIPEYSNLESVIIENTVRTKFSYEVRRGRDEEDIGWGKEAEEEIASSEEVKEENDVEEVEKVGKEENKEEKTGKTGENAEREEECEKEAVTEENAAAECQKASDSVNPSEKEQAKVLSAPSALNRIVPVYPRTARRRGHEGTVVVEISVRNTGEVSDVEVVGESGYRELDDAAVSAVRSARFAPATEDGVQVHGRLRLTFEFKLR